MSLFGHKDPIARVRRLLAGTRTPAPGAARRTRIIGHRGAAREQPENTVASFARAIELGACGVETDVCVTADGAFVLWHDNEPGDLVSLARDVGAEDYPWTSNWPTIADSARRPVWEMTLADMRELCGYSPDHGLAGVLDGDVTPTVPFAMLDELWRWAAGEPRLEDVFLDVKIEPDQADKAIALVAAVAASRPRAELAVHLLLPERELLDALRGQRLPEGIHLLPDFERPGILEDATAIGARRVSMGFTKRRTWGDFERELTEVVLARDQEELDFVAVWTVNDEERVRAVLAHRVDALLTDDVPLLARLLGS